MIAGRVIAGFGNGINTATVPSKSKPIHAVKFHL